MKNWKKTARRELNKPYDSGNASEEVEIEASDMQFFEEFGSYSRFLVDFDSNETAYKTKSQKRKLPVETELPFEVVPRSTKNEVKNELLPIKTSEGKLVSQRILNDGVSGIINQTTAPAKEKRLKFEDAKHDARCHDFEEIKKVRKERNVESCSIDNAKESIAIISSLILEDPENNVAELKNLAGFVQQNDTEIIKLAFLSQLAIFKDIIPGYRIRKPSNAESGIKLSKEVKKLRTFETSLLESYQAYLVALETNLNHYKKVGDEGLVYTCIYCFCQLLQAAPHFNFRINLISVVVRSMNLASNFSRSSDVCCKTINFIFENDEIGEISLDIVKSIADMGKKRDFAINPCILDCLLMLRLTESPKSGNPGRMISKTQHGHISKKRKKINRYLQQAEGEMQQAEAVYDRQFKSKLQSETLKHVFLIYFKILKKHSDSSLVPSALEGLAKFAHLINVEFFDDLLVLLKNISLSQRADDSESYFSTKSNLYCITTVFRILANVGDSLSVDIVDFYIALYTQIIRLACVPGRIENLNLSCHNEIELLLVGIEFILKKREVIASLHAAFNGKSRGFLEKSFLVMFKSAQQLCFRLLKSSKISIFTN